MGGGGGGGTTTNTIQESELSKQQAEILKQLAPLITAYGAGTIPGMTQLTQSQQAGLNSVMPQLTQLLQASATSAAGGAPTAQMAQNAANTQQQVRADAAKMGVSPGDPRLAAGFAQIGEGLTKGNMPELSTIMAMFGSGQSAMNPQGLLTQMSQPAGSTSKTTQSAGAGDMLNTLGTLALIGKMIAIL